MTDTDDVPVLVVGAGPVGLSTAFFLAVHGIRPVVVERRATTGQHPRANTSPRTIELFRAAGLGDALDEVAWLPKDPYSWVLRDSGVGAVLGRNQLPRKHYERLMTCTPAPRTWVTSDQLERLLLAEITARGGQVHFTTRAVEVTAEDRRVRVTVLDQDTGERRDISCGYVVGADGAHSVIRDQLGITMPDREVVGTVHTACYRATITDPRFDRDARFCIVGNDEVYAAIGSLNGADLWTTHIMSYRDKPPGTTDLPTDQLLHLLRTAIGDPTVDIELIAAHPWEATHGLAARFRSGRVFLAGDAAHLQTSASALGMNTGIQDGHNLAWKLAAVLHGDAGPALLDTYEAERRPAAATSVDFSRTATGNVGIGAPRAADDPAQAQLRAMMFYRYRSTAISADPRDADLDVYRDAVRPGYRLPHHWLHANGTRLSTTDLPGPEWLLLTGSRGHAWTAAAEPLHGTVRSYRLVDEPTQDADALTDPDGHFRDLAGLQPDGAILVRPDGFVAWHTDTAAAKSLPTTLRRLLGHTP